MKLFKIVFKLLVSLTIVCCILIVAFASMVQFSDPNKYKDYFVQAIEYQTGQKMVLAGPLQIKLFPVPYLKIQNASINFQTDNSALDFRARNIEIRFKFFSFFTKTIKIKSFDAERVVVNNKIKIDSISAAASTSVLETKIPRFKIKMGTNTIDGNIDILNYSEIPQIKGKINIDTWQIQNGAENNNVSLLPWLSQFVGQIDVYAKRLKYDNHLFTNVEIICKLKQSSIRALTKGQYADGKFNFDLNFKKIDSQSLELMAKGEVLNKALNKIESNIKIVKSKKLTNLTGELISANWILPEVDILMKFLTSQKQGQITANLDLKVKQLWMEKILFEDTNINLMLNNDLKIDALGRLAQGNFKTNFVITNVASVNAGEIRGVFNLKRADASEFFQLFHSSAPLKGGTVDFTFSGNTKGTQLSEFKSHLTGKGLMNIKDIFLLNANLDSRLVDIWAVFFKLFSAKQKDTLFECGVFKFNINEGLLESKESIGLATSEIYALGGGKINLSNKKIALLFDVYPRSHINLEIGSMDNVIVISGSLDNPEYKVSPHAVIKEGGSILLGIATGGVSLLAEKLLKVATSKGSPCRYVLEQRSK